MSEKKPPDKPSDTQLLLQILAEVKINGQKIDRVYHDTQKIIRDTALRKIDFKQIKRRHHMDFSLVQGQPGSFAAVFTPANGLMQAGTHPVWTADDPTVVLTPASDGSTCDALAPAPPPPPPGAKKAATPKDVVSTFNLTISAISSDPAVGVLTASHAITVTVTPPPPPPLTGIDFIQTAG